MFAIEFAASIAALTASGASAGAIARPSEPIVAVAPPGGHGAGRDLVLKMLLAVLELRQRLLALLLGGLERCVLVFELLARRGELVAACGDLVARRLDPCPRRREALDRLDDLVAKLGDAADNGVLMRVEAVEVLGLRDRVGPRHRLEHDVDHVGRVRRVHAHEQLAKRRLGVLELLLDLL